MRVLRDPADVHALEPGEIRQLIERRIADLTGSGEYQLDELAFFVVVEPGDAIAAVDAAVGFPVLHNRLSGARFDEPSFHPSHEFIEEHSACLEMVFVLSDDGYGVEVFVPKGEGIDADLLTMCFRFAIPAEEHEP